MLKLVLAAVVAVAVFMQVAPAEAACRPVFVAGEGIIDSCTGNHRSPYPDPPPEPTVIYVDITFAPNINVNVNNVVTSTSISSANASANASAYSSSSSKSSGPKYVVKPRIVKPK